MLPIKSLDNESFSRLAEKAKKTINIYDPSWTDENYHDPGITFIELFAWLKEMQQFYIDQMGFGNFSKYIKLMGGKITHTNPSYVKAEAVSGSYGEGEGEISKTCAIPKGSRAYAGNIPFETTATRYINFGDNFKLSNISSIETAMYSFETEQGKRIKCYPFGKECAEGSILSIYLDYPLAKGNQAELEFEIFEDYPIKRNIITEGFFELARFKWEYYTFGGWIGVNVQDSTHRFIRSGSVKFKPNEDMAPLENGKYAVRCTLVDSSYDVAPLINNISINTFSLVQMQTYSQDIDLRAENGVITMDTYLSLYANQEVYIYSGDGYERICSFEKNKDFAKGICEILIDDKDLPKTSVYKIISFDYEFADKRIVGIGNGFPYQVYEIDTGDQAIYYDKFTLATLEGSGEKTILKLWEKVEDFDASLKYDRHYILDEISGKIFFGDGINGMCPVGKILITGFCLTYGKDGNIARRRINYLNYGGGIINIRNDDHAYGGVNKESYNDALLRLRREMGSITRAVNKEDYESIVLNTPGLMVEKAIAYTPDKKFISRYECSPNTVVIAVKPYGEGEFPKLSDIYIRNILASFEKYRLLGTEIIIRSPEYISIEIYADLKLKDYYTDAQDSIKKNIEDFFKKEYSGFAAEIQHDSIYGIIDVHEAVEGISALLINAKGNYIARKDNGNIVFPDNGLSCLKNIHFTIRN